MADYAKSARLKKAPKSKTQVPAWVWLLTGTLTGLLIASLVYLSGVAPLPGSAAGTATPVAGEPPVTAPAERNKPTFEFYTRLPEKEVHVEPAAVNPPPVAASSVAPAPVTSSTAVSSPTSAATQTTAPVAVDAPKDGVVYRLQTGAFKQRSEADTLRAKLIMLGLDAQIQTVDSRGEVWSRVTVGPFSSSAQADAAKKILQQNGIANPMLLKQPAAVSPTTQPKS